MNSYVRSTGKKKSALSPNDKFDQKSFTSKNRCKTENSSYSTPYNLYNKQQIRTTIKKIVHNSANKYSKSIHESKEQKDREKLVKDHKFKTRMQIAIPNIRTSLTPKSLDQTKKNESKPHSTKANDNQKMFTSSGRYDLKNIFDKKKLSKGKDSKDNKQEQMVSPKSKNNNFISRRIDEESTLKFHKEEEFDVKECLTPEEYDKFGTRFPDKFKRLALLGRGGFSVVWLGLHRASKKKVAIKQILSKNPHETHLKEIWFGSYFFEKGGQAREQFQNHIGINNICRLISYEIQSTDSWLYYQICQESLGGCLFDLKGETVKGQKCYKVLYRDLIEQIRNNIDELKHLIVEIAKALFLMNTHNIVHSDLKTQNILIRTGKKQQGFPYIRSLKLIDFGSSFLFTNLKQFSMATPQYMPPQILNYILFQNKLQYDVMMLNKMQKYKNPWVIDVWSLGCIVLEIISGVPLWMSIPTRIENTNIKAAGLFAVKGRVFNKIIAKQIEIINNLDFHLDNHNYSRIIITQDLREILKSMLSLAPEDRCSPFQILNYFGVNCQPEKIPFY